MAKGNRPVPSGSWIIKAVGSKTPPSDEEFREAIEWSERHAQIPIRLADVEAYIQGLLDSNDEDLNEADAHSILDMIETVRQEHKAGNYFGALNLMRTLESEIRKVERRKLGKGAEAKRTTDRDIEIARQCLADPRWETAPALVKANIFKSYEGTMKINGFRRALNRGLTALGKK